MICGKRKFEIIKTQVLFEKMMRSARKYLTDGLFKEGESTMHGGLDCYNYVDPELKVGNYLIGIGRLC